MEDKKLLTPERTWDKNTSFTYFQVLSILLFQDALVILK